MEMHAGETETSMVAAIRPELVHTDRAAQQSGADQNRLADLKDAYAGIWWYARFPNHYGGDGSVASVELGEAAFAGQVEALVGMLRSVKRDETGPALRKRFFDEAARPLETVQ